MKRLNAPRTLRLHRKEKKWTVRPSAGPHKLTESIPLGLIIREYLGMCDTLREAKHILNNGEVLVDGIVRKDYKFPVGLMDIISIPTGKKQYRVLFDQRGKLTLVTIQTSDAEWKLRRIEKKTTLPGNKIQLNFHDGYCLIVDKDEYHSGDVLKMGFKDKKISEYRTDFRLDLRYISRGNFDAGVILDDYNDFYHGLLFDRQLDIGLKFIYISEGLAGEPDEKNATLDFSISRGWWDKFEAGYGVNYSWNRDIAGPFYQYHEILSHIFRLKFRSYKYEPGVGPGWERDSKYDIAFGVIPAFGQLYAEILFRPPGLERETYDTVSFLSLKNMENNDYATFSLSLIAGLGHNLMLNLSDFQLFKNSVIQIHNYGAGLIWDPRKFLEVSLRYEQQYYYHEFQDAEVTLDVKALF